MKTKYHLVLASVLPLLLCVSLIAGDNPRDRIKPLFLNRIKPLLVTVRGLRLWAGGELIAELTLTNGPSLDPPPVGTFSCAEDRTSLTFVPKGEGPVSIGITTAQGNTVRFVADRIQVLRDPLPSGMKPFLLAPR